MKFFTFTKQFQLPTINCVNTLIIRSRKMLKTCANGHSFHKSSDCPVCPVCDSINNPKEGIFASIGAPARRALLAQGIYSIRDLTKWSKKELLKLHGIGPNAANKIEKIAAEAGLNLKSE
jgi:hypothetical protein